MMGIDGSMLAICVGIGIAALWGWVLKFFCFNLDYSRTERVQFEDDEYYYYVKAVPKILFPMKEGSPRRERFPTREHSSAKETVRHGEDI